MQPYRPVNIIIVLALFSIIISGCGGSAIREVDVSEGEYYSQEEYQELSRKEKEAYCTNLEQELSQLQGQMQDRDTELQATRKQIESLRNQIKPIEQQLLRIDSDIRTLSSQIAELEALPKQWNIQPGECLWIISGYEEIYSDPVKWPRLYRANNDKILDPWWIYPDTVLVVPRDWPHRHEVALDESLSIIAGYWEVYGNPMEWTRLYEANKARIVDPDVIEPKQVIDIPRE